MWLFECGLDTVEWRKTVIVYLSSMAPIILSLYLLYKNKMKRWISLTLVSSFLIAALGWEIWVNFGLVDGDPVNFRRSDAMTCAIPMEINWLVNSLADTGIVWFAIILVYWILPERALTYEKFQLMSLFIFFTWFMGQNFLVEAVIYHNQVGGDAVISWAPLMPFGPYFNPTLLNFGERDITLQSQSAWIIGTIVFYLISIYFYKKTNGK